MGVFLVLGLIDGVFFVDIFRRIGAVKIKSVKHDLKKKNIL